MLQQFMQLMTFEEKIQRLNITGGFFVMKHYTCLSVTLVFVNRINKVMFIFGNKKIQGGKVKFFI